MQNKKKYPQKFTPLNVFKLNVAHKLLLYNYIADTKFREVHQAIFVFQASALNLNPS